MASAVLAGQVVLTGCAPGEAGPAARPSSAAPAVEDFRSTRTYTTVAPPVRLRIPAARVNATVEPRDRAADGTLTVPSRPELVGWYSAGPRPGQPGPAVLSGHVDWDKGPAVFFRLTALRAGDLVYVDRADGTTATFKVTGAMRVPKTRFPTDVVYGPTLEPALRLVTCGGAFDRATRNYQDNVVVFATPTA